MIGRIPSFLYGDESDQPALQKLAASLRNAEEASVLVRNYRKDGTAFWNELHVSPVLNEQGELTHFVAIINDISDRMQYEQQLEHKANCDDLTGLPNRNLMQDRLAQALIRAQRRNGIVALLFVDIDRFKIVNDSLGHQAGDRLLVDVAQRLRESVRANDTVARYAGDEFVVVLADVASVDDVTQMATRIMESLAAPINIDNQSLRVTLSIGASLYPRDGCEASMLIKNADTAMYRSKELGRNRFQFFTAELNDQLVARLKMEAALREAVERGEFFLEYQPQLDLRSRRIVGYEALVRWRHPELGVVSPLEFIPLAEETGLIVPIGEWVLRSACRQAKAWQDAGLRPDSIAVNVSASQLRDGLLEKVTRDVLEETGLDPAWLELELTESTLMDQPEESITMIQRLKALGLSLAMDDFGTGYSSLSYLHRFAFDKLKIDRAFVTDLTTNPQSAAIALSILAMTREFGMRVIAEGVETEAQFHYLARHGCDVIQGYLVARPLCEDAAVALLRQRWERIGLEVDSSEPTLLIVDHEPDAIAPMQRALRREGYRILAANSTAAALDLLALHEVHVIVSDQRMPDMDGTQFLGQVRLLHPNAVRIICCSRSDLDTITRAVNQGWVYKILFKPCPYDELKRQLREAFALHREQAARCNHSARQTCVADPPDDMAG